MLRILFICVVGINTFYAQPPNTKLRLFAQTTGFDSIVAKNDSLYFYTKDSIHKAYLPYLINSAKYANDSLKIFQGQVNFTVEVKDNSFGLRQNSHGFNLSSFGILPITFNTATGRYDLALADTISNSSDLLMVRSVNADSIIIQNTGYLNVTHGLDVGYWWLLDDLTPGGIKRADTTILNCDSGQVIQRLFFTPTASKILIQPEEPYICERTAPSSAPPTLAACPQMVFKMTLHYFL